MPTPPSPLPPARPAHDAPISFRRPGRSLSVAVIVVSFLGCAVAHFTTPFTSHLHSWHSVHYLVFFVPIVMAGLWFGTGPGLVVAALAGLTYTPYSLRHIEPGSAAGWTQTLLELGLYLMVGGLMGWVANRERRERGRVEAAHAELQARTDQLLVAERQLAQAERLSALGRLAATIAHEVRNPLGSIKGSAEILRDDFPREHAKYEFLSILVKEANRLDAVLDNFLEFARAPSLKLTPVLLQAVLENVIALISPQCRSLLIDPVVECDAEPMEVAADERQLQQALLNMVLNAMQAMPAGGTLTLRCTRATSLDGPRALITIADTGPGLSEDQAAKAFEPFFSAKAGGTGLGLTTVRKIIEAHGGTVTLANRPNGVSGALARITLPLGGAARGDGSGAEVEHGRA